MRIKYGCRKIWTHHTLLQDPAAEVYATRVIRCNQCFDELKMVCGEPLTLQHPPCRRLYHTKETSDSWCVCTWLIYHRIQDFLFHYCRSGHPCSICIRPESGKGSRFTQLLLQARKSFRIGQPPMGKMLSVQSCCLFAISVSSSLYEMHIGLFRIRTLLHSLLLRLTVAH